MRYLIPVVCCLLACVSKVLCARDFHVMVHNLENLFDVDGQSQFEDYQPSIRGRQGYGPKHLRTKLDALVDLLRNTEIPKGPDVMLFQELERDQTPSHPPEGYDALLERYRETSVSAMLGDGFDDEVADLPAAFLLLKHLHDHGFGPYRVALAASSAPPEGAPPHVNAVFTKFPILYQKVHPTKEAREVQELGISVEGAPFIVFNNHWKSGASRPETESIRLANAKVLRGALDAVLRQNDSADVLVAGDFNTFYNASAALRRSWDWRGPFALDLLGSTGDERAVALGQTSALYNLWFELPAHHRRSDAYRGSWGTLMQMLLTPGLYDQDGVAYRDGSFRVLAIPGLTIAGPWGLPRRWTFLGESGGGLSDHLPLLATFSIRPEPGLSGDESTWSNAPEAPSEFLQIDFAEVPSGELPSAKMLAGTPASVWGESVGTVFTVEGTWSRSRRWEVSVEGVRFSVWSFDESVRDWLNDRRPGEQVRFLGEFGEFRRRAQFVIQDLRWLP